MNWVHTIEERETFTPGMYDRLNVRDESLLLSLILLDEVHYDGYDRCYYDHGDDAYDEHFLCLWLHFAISKEFENVVQTIIDFKHGDT